MAQLSNQPYTQNGQQMYYSGPSEGFPGTTGATQTTSTSMTASPTAQPAATPTTAPTTPAVPAPVNNPPESPAEAPQTNLEPDQQGSDVEKLQQFLVKSGYMTQEQVATGVGIYGPQTKMAVMKLQQDLGVNGGQYAGFYGPQTRAALEKKYQGAFGAMKEGQVPDDPAGAKMALDQYFKDNNDKAMTQQDYFEQLAAMNPVEASMFETLSGLLTSTNDRQSLVDFYKGELAAQQLPELNMELADINRIMEGTEDDIRAEVERAGGIATESQVQALSGARNKVLMRKAKYLNDLIQSKNDYVNTIVSLTKADREEVDKELDRKLGISKMMYDMTTKMQDRAAENYRTVIKDVGYDGLIGSMRSPQDLERAAKSLGMSPQLLLKLASVPTAAQRAQKLDEMNYQLSVDKFNEDKRQFGLQYALEQQKAATQNAANAIANPYQQERSARNLQSIDELIPLVSGTTVGLGSLAAYAPNTKARDFQAQVETLKANIAFGELAAMREASKTGGALGQISDREGQLLQASLGALDTGQSPESFKKQLGKIQENIWRWNNQMMAAAKGFDYSTAKKMTNPKTGKPYTEGEIYQYLMMH